MDCERDRSEVIVKRNSVSDTRHVKFSPRVKILNKEFRGGCRSCSEILLTGIGDGSAGSLDSSDTLTSPSSKASCGDIVRVDSQLLPNSVGENGMPQFSTGGSNEVEEFTKECQESDDACLVEDVPAILSPSIRVVECPEDHDPNSPAFIIDSRLPILEKNPTPEDLLFSIHVGSSSSSSDDASSRGNKLRELPKSGKSFRSEELCESSKSREAYTSGEIHETKESRSTEKLKTNGSRKSGDLGRFGQILPANAEVEPNKDIHMEEEAMSVYVKRGEKGILVDTRMKDSHDASSSKHTLGGTVALPKKKKFSCKSCHCFKWPRCSFKRLLFHGCFFCEKPSNRLKYPKWAGPCFKCLYWPCLICRC